MGKLRIRARLGTCGRCGGKLGNPLRHVCVTRADRPRRRKRTRIRPKVSLERKCPACGKNAPNPLTHTCTARTDFRRKLATAKRAGKPGGSKKPPRVKVVRPGGDGQHPVPAACRDVDCGRRTCQAYKDGYAAGVADGLEAGR